MSGENCDTRIYERLTHLEVAVGRMEERFESLEESHDEYRQDVKDLKKSSVVMEVRLGIAISIAVFVIHWIFNKLQ